ncbi:hypothetical protein H2248_002021 [Termitomyces sp. 'cryptogamus']|nr:hypothetical protein H2248_002021 [Termitomyces sp. 'cryptogamus']
MTIEVFSVDTRKINHAANRDLDNSSMTMFVLRLEVPPSRDQELESAICEWTSCFARSCRTTLGALCTPVHQSLGLGSGLGVGSGLGLGLGYGYGYEADVEATMDVREGVRALLGCGMPLPKSPSMVFKGSVAAGAGAVSVIGAGEGEREREEREEREERGWWSVRFRQVFREVVRREGGLG